MPTGAPAAGGTEAVRVKHHIKRPYKRSTILPKPGQSLSKFASEFYFPSYSIRSPFSASFAQAFTSQRRGSSPSTHSCICAYRLLRVARATQKRYCTRVRPLLPKAVSSFSISSIWTGTRNANSAEQRSHSKSCAIDLHGSRPMSLGFSSDESSALPCKRDQQTSGKHLQDLVEGG
jgi:hypothetical protein